MGISNRMFQGVTETPSPFIGTTCVSMSQPRVVGKFIFVGDDKFYIKGVSYGAFKPNAEKCEYYDSAQIEQDFALMAAHGFNTVRIPHTVPSAFSPSEDIPT